MTSKMDYAFSFKNKINLLSFIINLFKTDNKLFF